MAVTIKRVEARHLNRSNVRFDSYVQTISFLLNTHKVLKLKFWQLSNRCKIAIELSQKVSFPANIYIYIYMTPERKVVWPQQNILYSSTSRKEEMNSTLNTVSNKMNYYGWSNLVSTTNEIQIMLLKKLRHLVSTKCK